MPLYLGHTTAELLLDALPVEEMEAANAVLLEKARTPLLRRARMQKRSICQKTYLMLVTMARTSSSFMPRLPSPVLMHHTS